MENELKTIHSLTNDIWQWIKSSIDMSGTDKEWEIVLEQGQAIANKPEYKSIKEMATGWVLAYVNYLEEKVNGKG